MQRLILLLLLVLLIALTGCSSCNEEFSKLSGPVARARGAAIVTAEEMVVGEQITQDLKDWALANAAHWEELWQMVKISNGETAQE